MANELKHGTVGTELTQAEWEAVGAHVLDSQATGDIVYASSSSQLRRLAKGTDTHVLILSSGIPAWSATTGITAVGTIATGVWQGTDVGVAYGGTGVSTLAANGVLTGNGASAIVAETNLTFDGSTLYLNDDANAEMTTGLTINQGADNDQMLAGKQSEIAHGMIDLVETDTAWAIYQAVADAGGFEVRGYSEDNEAVELRAHVTSVDVNKATSAGAAIHLNARLKSVDTAGAMSADSNLVKISNYATTRFLFDAEGSGHADVEWVAFDEHEDIQILDDLEIALRDDGSPEVYDLAALSKLGIVGKGSFHYENGRPRAMVNWMRLAMAQLGATRQAYRRIEELERRLALAGT